MQGFTFGGTSARSNGNGIRITDEERSAVEEYFSENAKNMSARDGVWYLLDRGWTAYQIFKSEYFTYAEDSKKLGPDGRPVRLAGEPRRLQHINHDKNAWELARSRNVK
jgi:hypothetical protein